MARQNQKTQYKITMPLYFKKTYASLNDVEKESDEDALEFCRKVQVFRDMEERYPTKEAIEAYVKTFKPSEFAECLINCNEYDAEWNPDKFEIQFKVPSDESIQDIRNGINFISLADGQWESSDTNGWTVKTDPPGGNGYGAAYGYEYGLTDFKRAEVSVELLPTPGPTPGPTPAIQAARANVPNESNNNSSVVSKATTRYEYSNTENIEIPNNNGNSNGGKRRARKIRKTRKAKTKRVRKQTRKNRK
jgi:hypothetical protein